MHSVMMVLQGRDAAGKDGAVKHVVGALNPRGVQVTSFGVPTPEEREHDFLWRVHRHAPRLGEFAIFNRSHYEDVLVVRVHRASCPRRCGRSATAMISDFERSCSRPARIVLKYFLHITKDEQKERLLEREEDPRNAWKLNAERLEGARAAGTSTPSAYEDAIGKCATDARALVRGAGERQVVPQPGHRGEPGGGAPSAAQALARDAGRGGEDREARSERVARRRAGPGAVQESQVASVAPPAALQPTMTFRTPRALRSSGRRFR